MRWCQWTQINLYVCSFLQQVCQIFTQHTVCWHLCADISVHPPKGEKADTVIGVWSVRTLHSLDPSRMSWGSQSHPYLSAPDNFQEGVVIHLEEYYIGLISRSTTWSEEAVWPTLVSLSYPSHACRVSESLPACISFVVSFAKEEHVTKGSSWEVSSIHLRFGLFFQRINQNPSWHTVWWQLGYAGLISQPLKISLQYP